VSTDETGHVPKGEGRICPGDPGWNRDNLPHHTSFSRSAYNPRVRRLFAQLVLLPTVCLWEGQPSASAQPPSPVLPDEWKRAPSCPAPLSVANGQLPAGGRYISQISFSNVAGMPVADQEQIIASLKQQRYSGTPDEIVKQLLERVNAEWANLGFVNVRSRGDAWLVSGNPAGEGISMNVYVEEGPRYKLGGISFQNNRAIASLEVLRLQFHIRDGAIFSRKRSRRELKTFVLPTGNSATSTSPQFRAPHLMKTMD
jgi:hypothetical protein